MENNNLNNPPPFYVGQKVICIKEIIDDWSSTELEEGCKGPLLYEKYTVRSIKNVVGWGITLEEIINPKFKYIDFLGEAYFAAENFRSIQESPFPNMTLKEVVKKESQLISIN